MSRNLHRASALAALLILLGALLSPVRAQSPSGSVSGVVTDSTGAVTPGATVSATSSETGQIRSALTDARGRYRLLDLPPGAYRIEAVLSGFAPAVTPGVTVQIGTDTGVDLGLGVGPVAERVEVDASASQLDTRMSSLGGVVTRTQIAELPLNGRNFLQLATLQPGVVVSRASGREFTGGFGTTQLAVAGARPDHVGYLLDGTNIADISDKAPSSVAGVMLGVDAVREFSVQTHGYSAEFGRAAGGIISAVTKSGTNEWRGSAFVFHRDEALNARGYFDTGEVPDFLRNQAGGSLGGPLARNRLFAFGTYEGLRERRGVTRAARLPNQAAHDGVLPAADGRLEAVAIHPAVRPYLDLLFPIPDGTDFGDGTAELRHAHADPTDDDYGLLRLDWNAGAHDTVMVRVSRDVGAATSSLPHPLFVNTTATQTTYTTAQHQRVIGHHGLNALRVAWNLTGRDDDMVSTVAIPPSLNFTEDPHFGAINVIGLSMVGATASVPIRYRQRLFQVAETFTWSAGNHTWKAGLDWQRYAFGGYSYSRYGGEYRFRNLAEFLTLRRSATAQADRFTGNLPGTDTRRALTQHYVAGFVQDEWRPRPTLSLSAGVRYDLTTAPTERDGRVAGLVSLDDLESGPRGVTPGTPLYRDPSGRRLAPRVGAAWDVRGDGRTVVRGGAGVFVQPLTVSYYRSTVFRIYPFFAGVDIRQPSVFGPGMQAVLATGGSASVQRRSEFITYDARQPWVAQWHGAVERTLPWDLRAEVSYMGSRGYDLPFYGDPNAIPAERTADGSKRVVPGASLRYPSWGRIRTRTNVARSLAHVVTAGLKKQTQGLLAQVAYTFGHARDTWSGGLAGTSDFENGAGSATDWWDPEDEYGPSNFDVRHSVVAHLVYDLPWGRGHSGPTGALMRGWSVGAVLQLASGLPLTPFIGFDRAGDGQSDADVIQKPDQVAPVTYLRTPDAWFDVRAFSLPRAGYYGNARRNSLRGPGLGTVDLTIARHGRIGRTTVQLRVEVFNALNRVNFGLPDASVLFNTDGTYRAGAGRITTTATAARQAQLGLKLTF